MWDWTMMISQPAWITEDMVQSAIQDVSSKKAIEGIRLLPLVEGTCMLKTILRQPVKTVQRAGTAPPRTASGTNL
jgi:hypothetical protein